MGIIENGVINTKDRYGLEKEEYMELVEKHKEARSNGDKATMDLIEDRLEDINYHPECSALERGDYELAVQMWEE